MGWKWKKFELVPRTYLIENGFRGASSLSLFTDIRTFDKKSKEEYNSLNEFYKRDNRYEPEMLGMYLFRRYGFPNSYIDEYKQMWEWTIASPIPDLAFSFSPGGGGIGYRVSKRLDWKLHYNRFKDFKRYKNAEDKIFHKHNLSVFHPMKVNDNERWELFCKWAKVHKITDKEWESFTKDKQQDLYNQFWKESENRFDDLWEKYKPEIVKEYDKLDNMPSGNYGLSKKWINALDAILDDFLRPVRIRDSAFNAQGWTDDYDFNKEVEYYNINDDLEILFNNKEKE